jgi:radical SAM superfamily enzyme YgiQ (UPF0313 family)
MDVSSTAKMNLVDRDDMFGQQVKRPKKVTLIATPWLFFDHAEFRSQQLGLGYIGAYAEQFGHEIAAFIDPMLCGGHKIKVPVRTKLQETNRFGHPDSWIVDQIPSDTDVIGINAPFTDSRLALYPMVDAIKRRFPDVPVVIGGVLATTLAEQTLRKCPADIVVKGEGEIAFARILNDYPLEQIPGLVYRRNGEIVKSTKRSEQLKTVDQIPPPGYHFRPMDEYVKWSPRGDTADRTLSIISSRGCPFTCEFCSIPEKGQLWRPFTPERVLDEIKTAIDKWGVNHLEFEDDNFTLQEPRALEVLKYLAELRRKGHRFSCSFPNGIMIDKMTPSLAALLLEAGSDIIYLPVEAGDTRVLMAMDKPMAEHHLAKTIEVAKWCVDAGLMVSCFFITAYPGGRLNRRHVKNQPAMAEFKDYLLTHPDDPGEVFMMGEDARSFENTLRYCKQLRDLGVGGITPLIATPYPGTELYEVCEKFGWLAFEDEHDVLTTVSYAAVTPGRVQIETPWCSRQEAYQRWKLMMDMFPTYHNVRKAGSERLLTGAEMHAFM